MLAESNAFSGFAVDDLERAREFYGDTLGLNAELLDGGPGLMTIHLAGGRDTFVYLKPDHQPANYTILNFPVDDIDAAVDGLTARGVSFERYEGMDQDEKGVARGPGPDIAWFKDPAGNILAVLRQGEG
jgi:catechol 2,3-dioxygenase-like lactoylglutathione lyase family enzyme